MVRNNLICPIVILSEDEFRCNSLDRKFVNKMESQNGDKGTTQNVEESFIFNIEEVYDKNDGHFIEKEWIINTKSKKKTFWLVTGYSPIFKRIFFEICTFEKRTHGLIQIAFKNGIEEKRWVHYGDPFTLSIKAEYFSDKIATSDDLKVELAYIVPEPKINFKKKLYSNAKHFYLIKDYIQQDYKEHFRKHEYDKLMNRESFWKGIKDCQGIPFIKELFFSDGVLSDSDKTIGNKFRLAMPNQEQCLYVLDNPGMFYSLDEIEKRPIFEFSELRHKKYTIFGLHNENNANIPYFPTFFYDNDAYNDINISPSHNNMYDFIAIPEKCTLYIFRSKYIFLNNPGDIKPFLYSSKYRTIQNKHESIAKNHPEFFPVYVDVFKTSPNDDFKVYYDEQSHRLKYHEENPVNQ